MTQFPRIHLNGTSGSVLLDEYRLAVTMMQDAIQAVQDITCHGRDYYVISSEAGSKAFAEKIERLKQLGQIRDDLAAIAQNVNDQMNVLSQKRGA